MKCDFCGNEILNKEDIINGESGSKICISCVSTINLLLNYTKENENCVDIKNKDSMNEFYFKSPKKIKEELDKYIIGQEKTKKILSVSVFNHYNRIMKRYHSTDVEIEKSNVLLIGKTGTGKTLLAKTISKIIGVPFAIADATSLTEAGYVGEDVENILNKLLQSAGGDIEQAEKGIVFIDEIDKLSRLSENKSITRDVSGEGVQQSLLKIIEGSVVSIPENGGRKSSNKKSIEINTDNILFICAGSFEGIEKIAKEKNKNKTIGFSSKDNSTNKNISVSEDIEQDDLIKFGIIPELLGRLHVISKLDDLEIEDYKRILTEPKNAIIKQYKEIFKYNDIELEFTNEVIETISKIAIEKKMGARVLKGIVENKLLDYIYNVEDFKNKKVVINDI